MPDFLLVSMATLDCARLASIEQWQRRIEQPVEVAFQQRLVALGQQQIVSARVQYLARQVSLTEERIPRQHPPGPVELREEGRGNREFGLGFRHRVSSNGFMGQRHPGRVTDRRHHIDRRPGLAVLELASERLAVQAGAGWDRAGPRWRREMGRQCASQRIDVQADEQPLQGGLARCLAGPEPEVVEHLGRLARTPFGDGQYRVLISQSALMANDRTADSG